MFTSLLAKMANLLLHPWMQLRLRQLGDRPLWCKVKHGFEMELDPCDYMDQAFYLGTYGSGIVFTIKNWVKPGDTCIDVGAHKGFITLHLARRVGGRGHVFAFEPDPRARRSLIRNCLRNGMNNVDIFEYALGREQDTCRFHLSSQQGWSTLFPNSLAAQTIVSEIEVRVRSLDQLVAKGELDLDVTKLSFVKIDCEGAEPFVLAGMKGILRSSNPLLWVEINIDALRVAGLSALAIQDALAESGYSIFLPEYHSAPFGRSCLSLNRIANIPTDSPGAFDIVALKYDGAVARVG